MVTEKKRVSARWIQAKLSAMAATALVSALGCGDAAQGLPRHSSNAEALVTAIDIHRSLVVTEVAILDGFSLQRVLGQLAAQSGVPGLTPKKLFQQWWDIFNPKPGLGLGAHCDDQVDATYEKIRQDGKKDT